MDELKLFSDKNKVRIIRILQHNKMCVCELELILSLTQTNLSNHLSKLHSFDYITVEKIGKWRYYSLNTNKMNNKLFDYIFELEEEVLDIDFKKYKYISSNYKACDITSDTKITIENEMEKYEK